jgi:hypothetical protein
VPSPYLLQNIAKLNTKQPGNPKQGRKNCLPQSSQFQGRQTFHFSRNVISEGEGMATMVIKGMRTLSNEEGKTHVLLLP